MERVKSDHEKFLRVFQVVKRQLFEELKGFELPVPAKQWMERSFDYNILGGKMTRGLSVIETYQSIVKDRDINETEFFECSVLGWCVEALQSFFLVADDIMDSSKTRRGQTCWYLREDVGMMAINDCLIIESFIYKLLKFHFDKRPFYLQMIELFHEMTYKTELGQLMDLITAPENTVDLDRFSSLKYAWIVKYKTAYYSFYLPVALAMIYGGIVEESTFSKAEQILLSIGDYFQVQDDYLDCYGDPETIGKIGTDIRDNKCSWLIVEALKHANADQRRCLHDNYGRKSDSCEAAVKHVYDQLDLVSKFRDYENQRYTSLNLMIDNFVSDSIPKELFLKIVQKIYRRNK